MFLNVEQLGKQLDKEDFQEIGSMTAFKVLETPFQMFITNRYYLNDEYVAVTRSYFQHYTQRSILEFRDILIQHLESVKKSIDERVQLKREYDGWVNERQMQTTEEKIDTSKALDASSVDKECSRTESKEHDISSRSGNDAHDDVADIKPIYDEEPMAEVQMTAEINVFAIRQQHTEQPEFNNEGEVIQNAEECHDTCPLPAILTDNQIPEHLYQSLKHENTCLKRTVAQFQKDFSRMETHCVNLELKHQNKVLKEEQQSQFLIEKSNEAKVKHDIDVIETINIELEHKVAKLHKENESLKKNYKELFDSIKITRAKNIEHTTSLIVTNDKFKAQVQEKGFAVAALKKELRKSTGNNVNTKFAKSSILGKSLSQPLKNQSVVRQPTAFKSERPRFSKPQIASAKPHHMIASSNSRISSKNMTRFSSNDMVHNHYLEEAKKRTQKRTRNSKPSLMPSARSKSIANGSKPMPRRNTQTSRNWPASKNSFVTTKTVPIAEHPRNSRNDSCLIKFLKEVNSCAKVPSNKTTNKNKPVMKKKTMTPRSCLRWKPMGKIFKTVGLRWVPTGRILTSSTTKVDSEPLNGSNENITNQYECEQPLDVSAGTLDLSAVKFKAGSRRCTSSRQDSYITTSVGIPIPPSHNNVEASDYDNPDPVPQQQDVSSSADEHILSQQELDLLFSPLYDEFFNAGSTLQDKQPSTNIQPTSSQSAPTDVHAEENTNDQEEGEQLQDDEFTNPLCIPAQEEAESSSHNIGNSNVPTFNQSQVSKYQWTKDHPLEQVRRNPSRPVKTRRQLATDPEMCMFALTEELHQFDRLQVWELIDKPFGKMIIKLKWLWKKKKDEDQTVIRNKARLVAKGYDQEEEEVYVAQPDGFVDPNRPKKVYHLRKALYGLKQAPRAKYPLEILHKYGMDKGQSIGTPMAMKPKLDADMSGNPIDQTDYCSKIGSLMYLTSSRPDIVQAVCFCVRYQSRPTEKHLKEVKRIFQYLRGTVHMGLWYPKGSSFELTAFSDVDHAGCIDTRKSTSGGIHFLGDKLVSWMLKKQNCIVMSSTEAEYLALSASCAQGHNFKIMASTTTKFRCTVTPVSHSNLMRPRTALPYQAHPYSVSLHKGTALPEDRFKYLLRRIGMRCLTPAELEVLAKESV
uniref:Reverse transcriptase Ty1/copia-type domain-containing protein n=1 Tax=Tanacetum cinerariifolium TaxID=118510 RepID=A0A6L2L5T8_TANCI|nr:hypothetical protein [Tanacetum cinerariifolium]